MGGRGKSLFMFIVVDLEKLVLLQPVPDLRGTMQNGLPAAWTLDIRTLRAPAKIILCPDKRKKQINEVDLRLSDGIKTLAANRHYSSLYIRL
jgi:hypothetical protein